MPRPRTPGKHPRTRCVYGVSSPADAIDAPGTPRTGPTAINRAVAGAGHPRGVSRNRSGPRLPGVRRLPPLTGPLTGRAGPIRTPSAHACDPAAIPGGGSGLNGGNGGSWCTGSSAEPRISTTWHTTARSFITGHTGSTHSAGALCDSPSGTGHRGPPPPLTRPGPPGVTATPGLIPIRNCPRHTSTTGTKPIRRQCRDHAARCA